MANKDREKYNAYMREYMLKRYHSRRAEAAKQLGGKCVRCGCKEDLQFDHIDPATKSFPIAKMWSINKKDFQAEVLKCQLLCQPCHNQKTLKDRGFKIAKGTHGTVSSRRYCNCDLCKKAVRDYQREKRRHSKRVF